MPAPASTSGWTSVGAFPSQVSPSALASRRAGSMVQTSALRPSAAARIATAAASVVFPTPPAPTHTSTRLGGGPPRARDRSPEPLRQRVAERHQLARCTSGVTSRGSCTSGASMVRNLSSATSVRRASSSWVCTSAPSPGRPARAARSAGPKRDCTDWLSTSAPTSIRRPPRSAWASSSVSLTGSSSGRLTSTAEVTAGSVRSSSIHPASEAIGPEGSVETRLCGTPRSVRAWPVAGRSSTMRSKPPGASGHWRRCHSTFPSMTVSASAGTKRRK
jgi:hypothetical protein